jgi:hypothetical protein
MKTSATPAIEPEAHAPRNISFPSYYVDRHGAHAAVAIVNWSLAKDGGPENQRIPDAARA